MLIAVIFLLLASLSYIFYIKYVTPPFAGDTMGQTVEVMQFGSSSNQVERSRNSSKSPFVFIDEGQKMAQSVQSNASTAQPAVSNESSASKASTVLSSSVQILPNDFSINAQMSHDQSDKDVKGRNEEIKNTPIDTESGKQVLQSIKLGAEKTTDANTLPATTDSAYSIENAQEGTADVTAHLQQPSSNASDSPQKISKKKKKSQRDERLDTDGKKTKKKKRHGSQTYDSDSKDGKKKKKSHGKKKKKHKRDENNSMSPKDVE